MSGLDLYEDILLQRLERGQDSGEFVDEGRKDIPGLAQIRVIPLAEKGSCRLLLIVKACTDQMSERRFADSRQAIEPLGVDLL